MLFGYWQSRLLEPEVSVEHDPTSLQGVQVDPELLEVLVWIDGAELVEKVRVCSVLDLV